MNVCFVGIGSIARRHIKNLCMVCAERRLDLNIDAVRRDTAAKEACIDLPLRKIYWGHDAVNEEYDAVFITNPTEYHIESLKKSLKYGKNFFIEKPVASIHQLEEAASLPLNENAIYYTACPLRYHAVIQYIKNNIDIQQITSVRSISSSYLPDWRPGIDYRKTYSADKNLGGGVSIDLIHEWDYLTFLFGMPQKVFCMSGKKSKLEINSEDYAIYMAEYTDKIIELHLDYFGRNTIRQIMLIAENDTICGDLVNHRLEFLKAGKVIQFHEERDDYQRRELMHFLDIIEGKAAPDNNISHAIDILRLTQGRI